MDITYAPKENPKVRLRTEHEAVEQQRCTHRWKAQGSYALQNLDGTLLRVFRQGRRLGNLEVNEHRSSCRSRDGH